jgi:tRNA modification GTPase
VEAFTAIEGIPVLITDTAGLHDTRDPVELAGIRKTRESMEQSDVLLFIIDGSRPITSQDKGIWKQVKHKNNILVVNKIDLVKETSPLKLPNFHPAGTTVMISAKTGEGLETLQKCVKNACFQADNIEPGRTIIPNLRQRMFLESALDELTGAQKRLQGGFDDELVMENLNTAKEELSKICGNGIEDNLLDQIFGRFCIGK